MTDNDNQNMEADDEDFVHRNWMTDRRIAGMICLVPASFMIAGAIPLADLTFFISCIVDAYSMWRHRVDLNHIALYQNLGTVLCIGGTLLTVWCMAKILKFAAR